MKIQDIKARILIVDDDEDDFIITSEYINSIPGNTFTIEWSKNYADGLIQLLAKNYDLYFVDYRLGAKSGIDFLKEAAAHNCEEPIVLLTGKGNYEVDLRAMQLGAVDYLIKTDLSTEKMERCIRYALERAATLKALRANERKYRSIFEKSKDIIFVTDLSLNFIDVNEAIETLLGFDKQEILKMNLCDLVENDQQKTELQMAIAGVDEVTDWEVAMLTKNKEKKFCILTLTLEESDKGQGYVQGIMHDITNLKKVEKATLQTEKLAAAGRLVRTIAHEVRNPLNNITLSVEQMQQEKVDEQSSLYLNIIQRNGRRISDLISELLNTSRPTEITLQREILQNILDEVISSSIDSLTLKRLKMQVNYVHDAVEIMADREKLKMALLNIVVNAIEAMQEDTGKLSISLEQTEYHAIVAISDNGSGISEENISRLFEPYFTQKRNGVGLGLTFTLNILQAHRAHIDVTSQPGQGTTFTIHFPLAS